MMRASSLGAIVLGGAAGATLGPRETFLAAGTLMSLAALVLMVRIRQTTARLAIDPSSVR
jgi:hypothetical protein